jgi:hypothetical protein
MELLPDPNGWITMSLARRPIRAVRIKASAALGVFPGLLTSIGQCSFAVKQSAQPPTRGVVLAEFKVSHRSPRLESSTGYTV